MSTLLVKTAIVCGPQACGKTRNKRKLAEHLGFGVAQIRDDAELEKDRRSALQSHCLYLTKISAGVAAKRYAEHGAAIYDYHAIMREIGGANE